MILFRGCIVVLIVSTIFILSVSSRSVKTRGQLDMKWVFGSKGPAGPMGNSGPHQADLKTIGSEGEFYFHPAKTVKIKGPDSAIGKTRTVPLLPYNNILLPGGTEFVHVFEMRYRQMMQEVEMGNGYFGFVHFNSNQQKLALVGTLAKIKSKKYREDGRCYIVAEGVSRFFLSEVVSELVRNPNPNP